jgi:Restriction endonuclease
VSVASIQQLVGLLAGAPAGTHGLLVTSGQLTSVAREFLVDLQASARVQVRVIDGVELTRLLQRYPAIVSTYFERRPEGRDADS